MKYLEQINNAIKEYEKNRHCKPGVVGMTPSMYNLLKNEIGVDVEPEGGWRTVYGISIDVQEVAHVPLFWLGGKVDFYTPPEHVDPEKLVKALDICANMPCGDNCPYFYTKDCTTEIKRDAVKVINELRGNKT